MDITQDTAEQLIKSNGSQFFGVTFIKRTTGEYRDLNGRTGVSKGVNGEGLAFNPEDKDLIKVWDAQKGAHRMINKLGITELRMDHVTFNVYQKEGGDES